MKKTTVVMSVLGILALCVASQAASFNVPFWYGGTNPMIDASGNTWGVYQTPDGTNIGAYVPFTWDQATISWIGTDMEFDAASFNSFTTLSGYGVRGHGSAYHIGAMTFAPPTDSYCSWYGTPDNWNTWGVELPVILNVGKFDRLGNYTSLYSVAGGQQTQFPLAVPALTNVFVRSGEKLAIYCLPDGYWSQSHLNMASEGRVVGINVDPAVSVKGIVIPDQYSSDFARVSISVDFSQNGVAVKSAKAFLASDGSFSFDGILPGIYDIAISGDTFLRKVIVGQDCTGALTDLGTITLFAGDIDGDNEITSTDLSILGLNLGLQGD